MGILRSKMEMKHIEVDFGKGPVTIYWRGKSLREEDLIDRARKESPVSGVIEAFIIRSRNEDGSRMFDDRHRTEIATDWDPEEVGKVVIAMQDSDREARGGDEGN